MYCYITLKRILKELSLFWSGYWYTRFRDHQCTTFLILWYPTMPSSHIMAFMTMGIVPEIIKGGTHACTEHALPCRAVYFPVSVETVYLCSLRLKSPVYLSCLRLDVSNRFIFVDREGNYRTYRIESLSDLWFLNFRYISTSFTKSWYFSASSGECRDCPLKWNGKSSLCVFFNSPVMTV